jgi:hypothetical protein
MNFDRITFKTVVGFLITVFVIIPPSILHADVPHSFNEHQMSSSGIFASMMACSEKLRKEGVAAEVSYSTCACMTDQIRYNFLPAQLNSPVIPNIRQIQHCLKIVGNKKHDFRGIGSSLFEPNRLGSWQVMNGQNHCVEKLGKNLVEQTKVSYCGCRLDSVREVYYHYGSDELLKAVKMVEGNGEPWSDAAKLLAKYYQICQSRAQHKEKTGQTSKLPKNMTPAFISTRATVCGDEQIVKVYSPKTKSKPGDWYIFELGKHLGSSVSRKLFDASQLAIFGFVVEYENGSADWFYYPDMNLSEFMLILQKLVSDCHNQQSDGFAKLYDSDVTYYVRDSRLRTNNGFGVGLRIGAAKTFFDFGEERISVQTGGRPLWESKEVLILGTLDHQAVSEFVFSVPLKRQLKPKTSSMFPVKPVSTDLQKKSDSYFSCSSSRLKSGDTLTITMSVPHGGDLKIHHPDGTQFFLAWWEPDTQAKPQPVIPYQVFRNMESLKLKTSETKATPWVYGRKENELVFTKTGTYLIRMSENLETDSGIHPVYECKVFFEK